MARVRIGALVAVLAAALVGACDAAARKKPAAAPARDVRETLSPKARQAFDELMKAEQFETSAVGVGATLSPNAEAVRTLIREREAPAAFQALFDRGSLAARLYALAAFWYLRPGEFAALAREVSARDGAKSVAVMAGCAGTEEKVAKFIDGGARNVDLPAPGSGAYSVLCSSVDDNFDFVSGKVPIDIVQGGNVDSARCAHPPPLPDYLKPRR